MNYIDIIFLIVIIYCTFMGLKHGLVRGLGGIVAIIVGFYGASIFYVKFSAWFQGLSNIFTPTIANIVAFVLLFILFNRLFMVLVFILDKIVSVPIISFLNKILGALFGFFAGALIIGIIVLIFSSFSDANITAFDNSQIVPRANKILEFVKPIIPKTIDMSFLNKVGFSNVSDVLNDLPDNDSMSVDELIDYLSKKGNFSKDAINKLKETEFSGKTNISIDEIKNKFQDYLDKLK